MRIRNFPVDISKIDFSSNLGGEGVCSNIFVLGFDLILSGPALRLVICPENCHWIWDSILDGGSSAQTGESKATRKMLENEDFFS